MYLTLRGKPPADTEPDTETDTKTDTKTGTASRTRPAVRRVAGTVVALGFVSMLTDISSESVNAVLPNYLIYVIGLSPQAFGVVNGLYNGVSAFVRVLGGWAADRTDRPKWIAVIGYGASAIAKVALLPAHSLGAFSTIASGDQLGKGLRTAPRDSMIVAVSPPSALGRAFGVHRSLDTFGAFLGPLLAFVILYLAPEDYHSVFVASMAFAFVGVAVLVLLVPDVRPARRRAENAAPAGPAEHTGATGHTGHHAAPAQRPRISLRLLLTPDMLRLTTAAGLLGLVSVGETYVFLELQYRDDLAGTYYPLLVVGMNFAYLAVAIPAGRLSDRIGRWPVFIAGYVALLLAYLGAGGPLNGTVITCLCLALLGAYYAATDGMLAAMAGRSTAPEIRASAIATAQTVLAGTAFFSSLIFALLWVAVGRAHALLVVAGALVLVIPVAAALLRRTAAARVASDDQPAAAS